MQPPAYLVRRLGPGDEAALAGLCSDTPDFTDDEGEVPLTPTDAQDYLRDPTVWHWHAEVRGEAVAFLMALVQRRRYGAARQVMLYEIGVRTAWRRRGVGRALMEALHRQMQAEDIEEVWVLADNPGAQAFYAACGYRTDELQGVMMSAAIGRAAPA
ncbi:GNAT family N-acetyltransferase [Deinococcus hohokamensis]|uniref:GNAT family N-acetyltransferase n=1 Tax=Deinococcus hohokamensis TaxID=309883 RepID=A0ABV9I6H8_9DEIO